MGRPEEHGFYAKRFPKTYTEHYLQCLQDPELHSLNSEIALLRSLMVRYLDNCEKATEQNRLEAIRQNPGIPNPTYVIVDPDMEMVIKACESIGRNVERMGAKKRVLTAAGAEFLIKTLAKIVYEEVGKTDPQAAHRVAERIKIIGPRKQDITVMAKPGKKTA